MESSWMIICFLLTNSYFQWCDLSLIMSCPAFYYPDFFSWLLIKMGGLSPSCKYDVFLMYPMHIWDVSYCKRKKRKKVWWISLFCWHKSHMEFGIFSLKLQSVSFACESHCEEIGLFDLLIWFCFKQNKPTFF